MVTLRQWEFGVEALLRRSIAGETRRAETLLVPSPSDPTSWQASGDSVDCWLDVEGLPVRDIPDSVIAEIQAAAIYAAKHLGVTIRC